MNYLVFDVESIGLHGEGYAVGGVVVDHRGKELESFCLACDPDMARGDDDDREWVSVNIPGIEITHRTPKEVRDAFWSLWTIWRRVPGTVLVSDCGWPVEARFLTACVDDDPQGRKWQGPYPLHDLSSVLMTSGRDPLEVSSRLPSELPLHNPLADARQSARILLEALGLPVPTSV